MKAFRNIGGSVVEIEVDVDPNGQPILPPDTTVDPRPEPQEGHYVTVVGNEWVQIPIPQEFLTFETKVRNALNKLKTYRGWYLNQPVQHMGKLFDADETARIRLTQALVVHSTIGYLPTAWIARDNTPFQISTIDDLKALATTVQTAFSTRFFEMEGIRQQILAAENEAQLEAIEIPTIPMNQNVLS